MDAIEKIPMKSTFLRYFKESKNSDLRGCHPYKRVSLPKNRYFLLQRWGKMDVIKRKQETKWNFILTTTN